LNEIRLCLLLAGSPRGPDSTSASLGCFLLERLARRGWDTRQVHVLAALQARDRTEEMLAAVQEANLLVLSFPLYVDSLPACTIRVLELIADQRAAFSDVKLQRLAAIANCGLPEARQNEIALAICRQFAHQAGFQWAGGLALGGGERIGGRPLSEAGRLARPVMSALEITAAALDEGQLVPELAARLMAKQALPKWVYSRAGNARIIWQARKYKSLKRLRRRPYRN
jgi:hypothetical protein